MPEAAMNKDRLPLMDKDKIGDAGKRAVMKVVSVPHAGCETSDYHLRARVLPPHPRHNLASSSRTYGIHGTPRMYARSMRAAFIPSSLRLGLIRS